MQNIRIKFCGLELRPDTASLNGTWSAYESNGAHAFGLGGVSLAKLMEAIRSA